MSDRPVTLLVVADGLRPSAIESGVMPYLSGIRDAGCHYTSAVATFPTVTRTNATSLVTGCLPNRHGVFGNRVWHAETGVLDTADAEHVRRLLAVGAMPQPSFIERLSRAGLSTIVVGNGSAGCTYLLNPGTTAGHGAMITSVGTSGTPFTALPAAAEPGLRQLGPPPTADGSMAWAAAAAAAAIDSMVPDLLVFWSGQPDIVHHRTGPSSECSRSVLRCVDGVIRDLHRAALATTRPCNLVVTSDHGFCESIESLELDDDLEAAATDAGIDRGDMIAAFNSGVILVFLREQVPPPRRARLAQHLAKQPWAGAVLCDDDYCPDNLLPASWATGGRSTFAPDIFVTLRTSGTAPGHAGAAVRAVHARTKGSPRNAGVHGTLHPADLHIPLILHGPSFTQKSVQSVPAGIIDIAPTMYQMIAGRTLPDADGRVLAEALLPSVSGPERTASCDVHSRERGGYRLTFQSTDQHRHLVGVTETGSS